MMRLVVFMAIAAIVYVSLDHVNSQARVCYFGTLLDLGLNNPANRYWMKQVLPEIRQRCPERVTLQHHTRGLGDATTMSTTLCLNPEPLGIEDGTIPDNRFRASSYLEGYSPSNARLNHDSFWQPTSYSQAWIEVDLVENTVVSGFITQGPPSLNSWGFGFILVKYKPLLQQSQLYVGSESHLIKTFLFNTADATVPVTHYFYKSIITTAVRLEPRGGAKEIALRFELLGCSLG